MNVFRIFVVPFAGALGTLAASGMCNLAFAQGSGDRAAVRAERQHHLELRAALRADRDRRIQGSPVMSFDQREIGSTRMQGQSASQGQASKGQPSQGQASQGQASQGQASQGQASGSASIPAISADDQRQFREQLREQLRQMSRQRQSVSESVTP